MPIILASQEEEMTRAAAGSQPGQIIPETLISIITITIKGLRESLKP
jgi:hypothetical protein